VSSFVTSVPNADEMRIERIDIAPRNERFGAFMGSLLLMPSGELLCSFGRIDFQREVHQQVVIQSTDRGRTWSAPHIIDEQPGVVKTMRGASLSRLGDGRIAMITNAPEDGFLIRWSHNDGHTWDEPTLGGSLGTVPCSNLIVETSDGLLLTARASTRVTPVKKYVTAYRSTDGGQTWHGPDVIAEDPHLNLTEPSTIRLADGRFMTVIRENSYAFYPSYAIYSNDDGATWSDLQPLPLFGHEMYLGQLQSGRALIAYRNVGGHAATFAWLGDADDSGYAVPATIRTITPPILRNDTLVISTCGGGEAAQYHLHPPESQESVIRIDAELRCVRNDGNACGIHVAQAGWIEFHPDHITLPECGDARTNIDCTSFHSFTITRDATELVVSADGAELLRAQRLERGEVMRNVGGRIAPRNVNAFGTVSPFFGSLEATSDGEAHWRSMSVKIDNPTHANVSYAWEAQSGRTPNWHEQLHMIELENNYGGSLYFVGQTAWVQFDDGEIFVVSGRQHIRDDGRRSSAITGRYLRESDFPFIHHSG